MDKDIFRKLLQKYAEGQELSSEEKEQLRQGYGQIVEEEYIATDSDPLLGPYEERGIMMRQKIDQRTKGARIRRFNFRTLSRVAAVLLVGFTLLAGTYWLWTGKSENNEQLAQQEDILPGSDKALLTLTDGSVISLSDAQNGTIATQGSVRIEKDAQGNIRYYSKEKEEASAPGINIIATPKGGKYRIILPDGSAALLNAASTLSYPVHFSGKERRVKMTGEVYFEIEKMSLPDEKGNVPFFVESAGQEVQVLGTHFNVNAYDNEAVIRTTLLEGSVIVRSNDGQSALLKPGQQAVLEKQLDIKQADIQQQLAWVNGDFVFRGETIESVLRQVERWYDVEVEYPPHIGRLRFNGMVSRSQPLSAIVRMIQSTKRASVTIKERRLVVTD